MQYSRAWFWVRFGLEKSLHFEKSEKVYGFRKESGDWAIKAFLIFYSAISVVDVTSQILEYR